jgi:hypothetical protein
MQLKLHWLNVIGVNPQSIEPPGLPGVWGQVGGRKHIQWRAEAIEYVVLSREAQRLLFYIGYKAD